MQLYWQAYNGDTTQTIYQGDALCEADQCMAWRWCDTAVKNEGSCDKWEEQKERDFYAC